MSSNDITLWFSILCIFIHVAAASDCLSTAEEDHYKCHFGAKTPYRFIANRNDSQIHYPGCKEAKIWLIIRHGTRFPGKKVTARMVQSLPKLQRDIIERYKSNESMLPPDAIDDLIKWKLSVAIGDEMKLVEEGERELTDLAERFQSRFPTLLPEIYANQTFKFKHTPTQRAEESAKHFAIGLFGHRDSQRVWYHAPEKKDDILRSYKHCHRWQSEVNKNPAANEQMNLFVKSKVVNDTLDEISRLLGFPIDYDTASLMYSACGYETAWIPNADSPWCKFLSLENFKVLEYVEELDFFWIDGYGFPLTYEQMCPALRDVFQFFKSASAQKATLYFSHSGSILKLLARLGIAKDATPLTHDSFELHRDNRAWRAGRIDAFASNIGFILYECEKDGPRVLIMHQERIIQIPGCPENSPCPISVLEELFSDSIHRCRFEEICDL